MDRYFALRKGTIEGRGAVSSLVIVCAKCGEEGLFQQNGFGRKPPEVAIRHFHDLGWRVGQSASKDRCPKCATKQKEKPVMKLQPEFSSQPIAAATVAVKAVLPREMSKDDRRLIFAQLNDVYTDAGYSGDWTDQKVATVLGCPRVWVVEVREEFFGTIKDNE